MAAGNATNAFMLDMGVLLIALGVSWVVLNFSTLLTLQLRFPNMPHALQQKIGKTGATMFGGIVVAFVVFLFAAPVKPLWLMLFLHG